MMYNNAKYLFYLFLNKHQLETNKKTHKYNEDYVRRCRSIRKKYMVPSITWFDLSFFSVLFLFFYIIMPIRQFFCSSSTE